MSNQQIAPMAQLSIDERIQELEGFLQMQEEKLVQPKETLPMAPEIKLLPQQETSTDLLKSMSDNLEAMRKNQDLDRLYYKRNNPVSTDLPIYDWNEAIVPPGSIVQFSYKVPEGWVFNWRKFAVTYNDDTTYYIWVDGRFEPTLTDVLQDFGNLADVWIPPVRVYNKAEVWALNGGIGNSTYSVYFSGFTRRYRQIITELEFQGAELDGGEV